MSIERTIVSVLRQAERSREQEHRQMQRQIERNSKADYLQAKIEIAGARTAQLLAIYERYNDIVENAARSHLLFDFGAARKSFTPGVFSYPAQPPIKAEVDVYVPEESWTEKLFPSKKAKRITLEQEVIAKQEQADADFKLAVKKYNADKAAAETAWQVRESQRKKGTDAFNAKIETWEADYLAGTENAINLYLDQLFSQWDYSEGTIAKKTYIYNCASKRLILEATLHSKESLFRYEGYKYVKQQDSIEPISMKVTASNQHLRDLIINVAVGGLVLMFKNDIGGHFNEVVVNVNYNRICCASILLSKAQYLEFDFLDEDDYYTVVDTYLKIYKQLSTGVKPFDTLYEKLI